MTASPRPAPRARILVAEDEARFGRLLTAMLQREGYDAHHAVDGREALERLTLERFDLVLSDVQMPGLDGLRLLKEVKRLTPATEVVLMTAYATTQLAVEAMRAGARDCLIKPFEMQELRLKVGQILCDVAVPDEAAASVEARLFDNLVGRSPAMLDVMRLVAQVAPTDTTVLLRGETGTGKSLIARAIHRASRRAERPLMEIHCAALPDTLLESELFGHEKGTFTGANARKEGLLEAADGGTVFLDEIGEVTPPMQVKLLRFLQNREFVRLGGREVLRVDTRMVAATNCDLEAAIADGRFREDLYYRLNVFPIRVPPLRERAGDVARLVRHCLERVGRGPEAIDAEALALLERWRWPGNVRELENVVERCLVVAGEGVIRAAHLPPALRAAVAAAEGPAAVASATGPVSPPAAAPPGVPVPRLGDGFTLDDHERDLILAAIHQAEGNKSEAARLLGITRRRLYSMMDRFGLGD